MARSKCRCNRVEPTAWQGTVSVRESQSRESDGYEQTETGDVVQQEKASLGSLTCVSRQAGDAIPQEITLTAPANRRSIRTGTREVEAKAPRAEERTFHCKMRLSPEVQRSGLHPAGATATR
eukprot:2905182-Pyramimonas_sp.AAC.1